jgi:sporulation protein YlmC with PRC-barrel domain
MTRTLIATSALASALALAAAAPASAQVVEADEIVSLADWRYDDLYAAGVSAEEFIDEMEVLDVTGEEIGEVEDLLIGPDGRVVAIVAEVGGVWDIGDTHVSVPFDQVDMAAFEDGVVIPVTEETVDDYEVYGAQVLDLAEVATEVVAGTDDALVGGRLTRVSDLIGDYARLVQDEASPREYGYISDVILSEGEIAAVVVQPSAAYGGGYQAYPYYGYGAGVGYGYTPGGAYYDLPYGEAEVAEVEPFETERFDADVVEVE